MICIVAGFSYRKQSYQRNNRVIKTSTSQEEYYCRQNAYCRCCSSEHRAFEGAVSRHLSVKSAFKSLRIKTNAKARNFAKTLNSIFVIYSS